MFFRESVKKSVLFACEQMLSILIRFYIVHRGVLSKAVSKIVLFRREAAFLQIPTSLLNHIIMETSYVK